MPSGYRATTIVALVLALAPLLVGAAPASHAVIPPALPPLHPADGCAVVLAEPVEDAECSFLYEGGESLSAFVATQSSTDQHIYPTFHPNGDPVWLPFAATHHLLYSPFTNMQMVSARAYAGAVERGTLMTCRVHFGLEYFPGDDGTTGADQFGPGVVRCGHDPSAGTPVAA